MTSVFESGIVKSVPSEEVVPSEKGVTGGDLKRIHPENLTVITTHETALESGEPIPKHRRDMTEEEIKADEELKRLTTYYRHVPYEGVDRVWVYVKRLGRVVNFQITNVPYLIERFVAFYLSGNYLGNLQKLETSLERSLASVRQAKLDMEISV